MKIVVDTRVEFYININSQSTYVHEFIFLKRSAATIFFFFFARG